MYRAYYSAPTMVFLSDDADKILGELSRHHQFALEDLQRNAWVSQIRILKDLLEPLSNSHIAFEYSIPRMGKRVDVVILHAGIVFVLEFKVGEDSYPNSAVEQALDYALDLKNFHEQSHSKEIVPIVVATEAPDHELSISQYDDGVYYPIRSNRSNLVTFILAVSTRSILAEELNPEIWIDSNYRPTPTIIQAAQALYNGHSVREISRSDSGAINLDATTKAISEVIEASKHEKKKSICFVTGVPGAGKTLAGLNIANERHNIDEGEHAVFLSGNGPLVNVLQEALARNEVLENRRAGEQLTKTRALAKTKVFIQNIHHFRDDALQTDKPPIERVAVFDEAQRAWTLEQTSKFMARKKGIPDFSMSEPDFLISVLDRHQDWATIVCLIGGGQEINTGEAGLPEWFAAIKKEYPHWDVYASNELTDQEYTNGENIYSYLAEGQLSIRSELHLSVSVRSFRSEKLSAFVKSFLDSDKYEAANLFGQMKQDYPMVVTRSLEAAKDWLQLNARGSEGIGIVASSGAYRLKPYGIDVKSKIDPKTWFLNDSNDVRSSGFLEDVATEFEIQGLELDWTCVAWDADLRKQSDMWECKDFRGTRWQNIHDEVRKRYLLNAYRVLLTRARQGMVIFIPHGDPSDITRLPEFYDPVYQYFLECGVPCIKRT